MTSPAKRESVCVFMTKSRGGVTLISRKNLKLLQNKTLKVEFKWVT